MDNNNVVRLQVTGSVAINNTTFNLIYFKVLVESVSWLEASAVHAVNLTN